MDRIIQLLKHNWQQKMVALMTALVIWLFVNHSITATVVVPNVPIRIINLPPEKTVTGLQPNGILSKRIPLTISGSKDVIEQLEPGDVEILLDASTFTHNNWILQVNKKNLVSMNPDIDLSHHVTDVTNPSLVLHLAKLVTVKVPVQILHPKGKTPAGYEYLDIFPEKLMQTVTGPEDAVNKLATEGLTLELTFSQLPLKDLDKIKTSRQNYHDDEVSYYIPVQFKKVAIPFRNGGLEDLNDPEAQNLHIDFLRKEFLTIDRPIEIQVFYPLADAKTQSTPYTVQPRGPIKVENGVAYLDLPLQVRDVSVHFLETICDWLQIQVVQQGDQFVWGLQVVNPQMLEDVYINTLYDSLSPEWKREQKREATLRNRFWDFLQRLTLYRPDTHQPLVLEIKKVDNEILINAR